ncbi:hypothetical protein EVAR_11192_1 [Eumeta japonica]|uniref:Uncharacterized protein n=1 Tax=Eumeta variegata TaxID=151549 RepID=A0A4C1U4C8_EUMVA|nr:hypothetical protein EVAR_11192_1 [Eumeta japonica]
MNLVSKNPGLGKGLLQRCPDISVSCYVCPVWASYSPEVVFPSSWWSPSASLARRAIPQCDSRSPSPSSRVRKNASEHAASAADVARRASELPHVCGAGAGALFTADIACQARAIPTLA